MSEFPAQAQAAASAAGADVPEPADALDDPQVTSALFDELAALASVEYDRRRKQEAKRLGIREATLDKEVAKRRPDAADDPGAGTAVHFPEIEPWPEPIDGAALLDNLVAGFQRFVALPNSGPEAMALWTLHANAHDAAAISPLLALTSPEKRCGKTTALRVLGVLVPRPLSTANITVAPFFRSIEKWRPTLLLDEADAFLSYDDQLIGALNSGHCRETAFLVRSVGENHEPRTFHTWAPKAIALIGRLPATLEDRSIEIAIRRRRPDEHVERFHLARDDKGLNYLARCCARWAADHMARLSELEPDLPASLHDRAADNWEPLLAIADLAGERWPETARRVAVALSGSEQDEGSYKTMLLADIKVVFAARGADRLPSAELCKALHDMEERPWSEWRGGKYNPPKPISTRQVAAILRGFAIAPGTIRQTDSITAKGYYLDRFNDAFARYLPSQSVTTPQPKASADYSPFPIRHKGGDVTDEKPGKTAEHGHCDDVTDENPEIPDVRISDQEKPPSGDLWSNDL